MALSNFSVVSRPNHKAVVIKFTDDGSDADTLYIKGGQYANPTLINNNQFMEAFWFDPDNYDGKSNGYQLTDITPPSASGGNAASAVTANDWGALGSTVPQDDGTTNKAPMLRKLTSDAPLSITGDNYLLITGLEASTPYQFGTSSSPFASVLDHTTSSHDDSESLLCVLDDAGNKISPDADGATLPNGAAGIKAGVRNVVFYGGSTGGSIHVNGAELDMDADAIFHLSPTSQQYVYDGGFYRTGGGELISSPDTLLVREESVIFSFAQDPSQVGSTYNRSQTGRPLLMRERIAVQKTSPSELLGILCGRFIANAAATKRYNFLWIEQESPEIVQNQAASNVGSDSATLTWDDPQFLSRVVITPPDGAVPITVDAGVETVNITGLTAGALTQVTIDAEQDYPNPSYRTAV